MLETDTLTGLFRHLIRTALATQQVEASEATEFYLVRLLEQFTRPGRTDLLDPPLALDYLAAGHLPASQRYAKLKRVADTALFVTGLFVDSLDRTVVGVDYYTALGRNAYARLSAEPGRAAQAAPFEDLAGRFLDFVRVLMEVSERDIFRREQDTLRLYKRWLHTGGQREADLLVRRGIIPVASRSSLRH
ncbi:MAG TPA: hypothetical protein VKW76_11870 [Candidatus Binatia bacterium]|nr:hypothetical protein [Candidatus Binatia bacterium]